MQPSTIPPIPPPPPPPPPPNDINTTSHPDLPTPPPIYNQLLTSLPILPNLSHILNLPITHSNEITSKAHVAQILLNQMKEAVKMVDPSIFPVKPNSHIIPTFFPPIPTVLPQKRLRTRQPHLNPTTPQQQQQQHTETKGGTFKPILVPASEMKHILSKKDLQEAVMLINSVPNSQSKDERGEEGDGEGERGEKGEERDRDVLRIKINETTQGDDDEILNGSFQISLGRIAHGICYFGTRLRKVREINKEGVIIYRVNMVSRSEQISKHSASQYKALTDLSIHLTGLELSLSELIVRFPSTSPLFHWYKTKFRERDAHSLSSSRQHRIPAYFTLKDLPCHFCSNLLRSGVIPVGRAFLPSSKNEMETPRDVPHDDIGEMKGSWIAFHPSCWEESISSN